MLPGQYHAQCAPEMFSSISCWLSLSDAHTILLHILGTKDAVPRGCIREMEESLFLCLVVFDITFKVLKLLFFCGSVFQLLLFS